MLALSRVSAGYGRAQIIHEISLHVSEGEIVSLLGSNGAGKTTTLLTAIGVLPVSVGSITFLGERVDTLRAAALVKRGMAIVPEGRRVFAPMTVEENLQVGAAVKKSKDKGKTFEFVYHLFPRLHERRRQLAGTLSGGEQQMLAIGRALVAEPRLILMDEPSMGLSPVLCEQILEIIQTIRKQLGVSILIVEQNVFAALSIADRGYVIQAGQVVLEGKAAELLNNELVREAYL